MLEKVGVDLLEQLLTNNNNNWGITRVGKDVGILDYLYLAVGDIKWCSLWKTVGDSSKS